MMAHLTIACRPAYRIHRIVQADPQTSQSRMIRRRYLALVAVVLSYSRIVAGFSAPSATDRRQTLGEQIQKATTLSDLLDVAERVWLPTDPDLPSHLKVQRVHHEKRQRWSAQLLTKLGGTTAVTADAWRDQRLARAIKGASIPFEDDRPLKEGRYVKESLLGLYNMMSSCSEQDVELPVDVVEATGQLMGRAENMAALLPFPDAVEARWACKGLRARSSQIANHVGCLSELDARVDLLPFDIIPRAVDWSAVAAPETDILHALADNIPFNFDQIVTRTGASVTERRGTAWIADEGIGALAYSGKLMAPKAISPIVRSAMDEVEKSILKDGDAHPRPFFDCALCNHYPDGDSACKFHTDPEHGSHWERLTCVVAAGQARRFAFRPIPGLSSWSQWDPQALETRGDPCDPAVICLFPGDVVKMFGSCNDDFHHAVYPDSSAAAVDERISLVLKRAIRRSGGKRGHALAGQGRRARRQAKAGGPTEVQQRRSNDSPTKRKRQKRS